VVVRTGEVRIPAVQPLQRLSIIDRVELELRASIYRGELRCGDPIPEVQVSRAMGVSRSSLREACQRLVRDGILTQHPGRGLFVTTFDTRATRAFLQYREAIEVQAATLLARRIAALRLDGADAEADALLTPVRSLLETMSTGLDDEDPMTAGNADLDLHLRIAELSGNVFLSTAMGTIVILTRMQSFADPLGYGVDRALVPSHADLLEALAAGDEGRAQERVRVMLAQVAVRRLAEHADGPAPDLLRDPELRSRPAPGWNTLGVGTAESGDERI
jgi:DNA-binding GntR family transcriptional regulator